MLRVVEDQPDISFGVVLRRLRAGVRLTQEELAEAAGLSARAVSDLERGINRTARKESALLLAGALGLAGQARELFVAAARGRAPAWQVLAAWQETAAVDQVGAEAGPVGALPAVPAVPQVRYSLPADAAAFTGRGGELGLITAAVEAAGAGGVVAVGAVDGMPGVGKTALAVHAAHALTERFPDRQLFVDLHAHTPGREPVRPEDALAGLLAAVGVDPRYLPGDLAGRAALWRDRMAGRQALLVLDNAASTSQVSPLLPGGGECLVLVTSRRRLGDLPGAITPVLVDALPLEQAVEMFSRLAPQAAVDPDGVAEVVRLTGCLPLAVSLLARVVARHPSWNLADLIAETRAGVLTMTAEHDSVAAAFEVSYRHLDPDSQRLFRLLGVHPGTSIDGYAAAALAGISLADVAGLLDGLHQEGLLTEAGYRRYGMHDLLRRYARDLVTEDPAESERALGGLLDYYQHAAALAGIWMARQTRPGLVLSAPVEFEIPELKDAGQALAWARVDRANLLACLDLAERTGQHARLVALTAGLAAVFRRDGPWVEAVTRHIAAAEAALHIGDQLGEASALHDLGEMRHLTGDYPGAAQVFEQALGIYRGLGDWLGEANALTNLGNVRRLTGDYQAAAQVLEQALGIYRDLGDQPGEAHALNELGAVQFLTGDYPCTVRLVEQALGIYRGLGDQLGEANALHNLGNVRHTTADYRAATQVYEQALGIYRGLGDRLGEAHAVTNLGNVRRRSGDYPAAAQGLEQALGIYRELGSRLGEAHALNILGMIRHQAGDYPGAAQALEQALGIYRDLGNRLGEAHALHDLGIVRYLTDDYPGATGLLEQALGIYRDLGDQQGQAEALNEQGTLHRARGDLSCAQECHQQALDLARLIGDAREEARALAGLGRCAVAIGHATQAEAMLRQAHEIFQRTGAAEAKDVLAELDALTRSVSAR